MIAPCLMRIPLSWLALALALPCCCAADERGRESLGLTLPRELAAVPGIPTSIYFDNIVLTEAPQAYRFDVECNLGKVEQRRWTVTPTADDVGHHPISITVSTLEGQQIAAASTALRVIPADAGAGDDLRLLIVGDSLTHATDYPNQLARLLSRPGNPDWQMLGTHKPPAAAAGVAHEGYGGWTWQRFVSKYEPDPDGTHRKRSSPFVYLVDGKPRLDVEQYLRVECAGTQPDFVIFMLGINDCFSAPPEMPDARIDAMFKQADVLLAAFRRAAPHAHFGICLTTPPNAREAAFQTNYKGRYPRWGWKQIQHRLVQRQLARFAQPDQQLVSVIPTQLNLDPIDGYPDNNGVHPNPAGYRQIGASIYAWLKSRLAE